MRVVLDTNVLVSALITPQGTCGTILRLALAGRIQPCVDGRLAHEYRVVVSLPRFEFCAEEVEEFLQILIRGAIPATPDPLRVRLPDPSDAPFLEVAVSEGAVLITGNLRHYPAHLRCGAAVVTPSEFITQLYSKA